MLITVDVDPFVDPAYWAEVKMKVKHRGKTEGRSLTVSFEKR